MPFLHWRGARLEVTEYPFVVNLFGDECLRESEHLEDLAYRFRSEDCKSNLPDINDNRLIFQPIACDRFQALVYGKTLEASVSIHKLRREARHSRTTLCNDTVLSFWRDPLTTATGIGSCTMLYFTITRHGGARELHEKPSKAPGASRFWWITYAPSAVFLETAKRNKCTSEDLEIAVCR